MPRRKIKLNKTKVKKEQKLFGYILIGFALIYIIHYSFFRPVLIGQDNRYLIYIFILPILLGLIVLTYYRHQFLYIEFRTAKSKVLIFFMLGFYLLEGIFFSYLSFGFIATLGWYYYNKSIASENTIEIIKCDVNRFWQGKHKDSVDFYFNGNFESFSVKNNFIKLYRDKDPKNYQVFITAKKGIWNYYVVSDWELRKIN